MPPQTHGAADSAVGYMYQTWYAFLELLQTDRERPDAAISLEMLDDVAWEEAGSPRELLSLKHHRTAASLTDKSDDLWRSLRVWRDTGAAIDPNGPHLVLVTTSAAPSDSACSMLRGDKLRNETAAVELLLAASRSSTNEGTKDARAWFTALSPSERAILATKILILDDATPIADVPAAVSAQLWWALPKGHEETFLSLLWAWWHAVALDMLQGKRGPVSRIEAQQAVSSLRDQFSADNLPTLVQLADVDEEAVAAALDERLFVKQLRWVTYTPPNLRRAMIDYYRAVEHTTRWLAEDLIGLAELRAFEDNLRDEWGRAFDDMVDDLGDDADDDTKAAAGKDLLRELLESTAVNVRERYNDRFFARGKRHEIADSGEFGWHPEFRDRVRALLSPTT